MDGAQGPAGDAVNFVQIADRTSTDPIVFEFYTGGSEGTLVSGSASLVLMISD